MCTVLYIAHSEKRIHVVRGAVARFSGLELMCFTADGLEALTLINLYKPNVAVVDALLGKISGSDIARTLAPAQTALTIVVLEETLATAELLAVLEKISA